MDVKVVVLPDGKDPDDFCKEHTLEEVQEFIASNERDFINFKIDVMLEEAGEDPLKRALLINDIADTISLIPDPVRRSVYMDLCSQRLEIEREVVKNRVEFTAGRLREEEWKRREAQKRQREMQLAAQAGTEEVKMPGMSGLRRVKEPESPLAPVEKSLLEFILNSGLEELRFPPGHKFYCDPPMTVADFIDSSLQNDNTVFESPVYRQIYDEYYKLYDAGFAQDDILRKLAANENNDVAATVAALSARRYELTEKNLRASLTNESTILVQGVPQTLLLYQLKIWEKKARECEAKMGAPGADIIPLMKELQDIRKVCVKLKEETGRL